MRITNAPPSYCFALETLTEGNRDNRADDAKGNITETLNR